MSKSYTHISIKPLETRQIEIEGEITLETMESMRAKTIAKLKETIEMDGFRKGNVPEQIIIQKLGEMKILEETAETALSNVYPEILHDEKIDAIGRPEITITKIAPQNPLSFRIKTFLAPEVKIANYKKIAEKINKEKREQVDVSLKEIDDVILDIRKSVTHTKMHENDKDGKHDHSHGELKTEELLPLDDKFLKEIGGFDTIEDLKQKIKEDIIRQKEVKAQDKKRTDILEEIIKESILEIPQIIVDAEHEKMLAQFKDDIARAGLDFSEYMTHIKKTEDDLKKEWGETSRKRADSQIILNTIARQENIVPEESLIKIEMGKILAEFKDAERFRVRMYVETFLTNNMVFTFLDSQ